MKINQKTSLVLLYCLLGISFSAMTNQPPSTITDRSYIQLDTRNSYNFHSIFLEKEDHEIILFEQVEDINFDKINIRFVQLPQDKNSSKQWLKINGQTVNSNYFTLVGHEYIQDTPWLYVSISDGYNNEAKIFKGKLSLDANLTEIVEIKLSENITGGSWPRYKKLNDNASIISYRKAKCCNLGLVRSNDGIRYEIDNSFNQSGAMPIVGTFDNGKIIYNYQRNFPAKKKYTYVPKSRFMIFDDNWQPEQLVSESIDEIHDAFPFTRLDGKVDMYYSHGFERVAEQLSLWRRCVSSDGSLGNEELVVGKEIGNIAKPYVYRKSNGKIALMFIEQGANLETGAIQYYVEIPNDATCDQ